MMLIMLYSGLQVSEVCNLDRKDIDFEEFTIAAKNARNRIDKTVTGTEKCINAIERYSAVPLRVTLLWYQLRVFTPLAVLHLS